MLISALLFYRKMVADLTGNGFKMNSYNPCIANKEIEGKQKTICWHVDYLKVSHKEETDVAKITEWLKVVCRKIKVSKGKH